MANTLIIHPFKLRQKGIPTKQMASIGQKKHPSSSLGAFHKQTMASDSMHGVGTSWLLQHVSTITGLLNLSIVQQKRCVGGLEIQGYQLAPHGPCYNWIVIGEVNIILAG